MERQKLPSLQGRLATFLRKVEYRFPGAPDKSQTIRTEVLNPITKGLKDPKDCLPVIEGCLRKARELVKEFEEIATTFEGDAAKRRQQSAPSESRLLDSRPDLVSSSLQPHRRTHAATVASGWHPPLANPSVPLHASTNNADQVPSPQQSQDGGHQDNVQNLLVLPELDIPPHQRKQTPKQMSCTLLEHQKIGLTWLIEQEKDRQKKGGLLADTMGLGKTVQALALILARPSKDRNCKTTLIVAPLALLKQWEQEILTKVEPRYKLKTLVLHGPNAKLRTVSDILKYDIVLCTYGKLQIEYKNKFEHNQPAKLRILAQNAKFHRVILDEAHNIRNQLTYGSKAAAEIQSTYRLCMTGTPFMNRAEEIFPLIRFLNIPPYNVWERFSEDIVRPLRNWEGDVKEQGMIKLQALFRSFTLRRTKDSQLDGKRIIELPPRTDQPAYTAFDDEQQEFYKALEVQQQLQFNRYLVNGAVMKNYIHILILLLRLRQACDHPFLLKNRGIPEGTKLDERQMIKLACGLPRDVVDALRLQNQFDCLICSSVTENPIIIHPCGHHICANCFSASVVVSESEELGDDQADDDDGSKARQNRLVPCPGEQCKHSITPKNIICYNLLNDVPDSDSESDDDEISQDDIDRYGNLRDFVIDSDDSSDDGSSDNEGDFYDANEYDEGNDSEHESDGDGRMAYIGESAIFQMDGADDELDSELEIRTPKRKISASMLGAHSRKRSRTVAERMSDIQKGKGTKVKYLSLADQRQAAQRSAVAMNRYKERLRKEFISSAKIDAIMEILEDIRPTREKTLIFSLWTSFLDLVEIPIERAKIKFTRYDGSISPKAREAAVKSFMEDPTIKVMLVSLTAGNAGLNLTAASQVIVTEPFWNPYVEEQAIDRAHRIGQKRPVTVHRLLISGTVEDRIVALQERKKMLVDAALSEKGAKSVSRLNVAELRNLFGL